MIWPPPRSPLFPYAPLSRSPPCEPSPTTCTGPPLPPVAAPPAPPVAVAVWVLVAVFSCLHWLAPLVVPVASWLQTAEMVPPVSSDKGSSHPQRADPELSPPE